MLKQTLILVLLFSSNAFSINVCKEIIINFYNEVGITLQRDAFNSLTFNETKLSTKQFNALTTQEQMKLFKKLMPTSMIAKRTLPHIEALIKKVRIIIYQLYVDVNNNFTKIYDLMDKENILIQYKEQITKCT